MARTNGGIIGKTNQASFGKCVVTSVTATGTFTATNPGTRAGQVLIVSGGGGSGSFSGGGAGGAKVFCSLPIPTSGVPVIIGGGGAALPARASGNNTYFGSTFTTGGGGGGGEGTAPNPSPAIGVPGGSGGGAGICGCGTPGTPIAGGTGVCGEGFPGGSFTSPGAGGGGGGAGAAGQNGQTPFLPGGCGSADGGAGIDVTPFFGTAPQPFYLSNVTGTGATASGIFAGGGGSGGLTNWNLQAGSGGTGGGGNGAAGTFPGGAGTAYNGRENSGGGGGSGDAAGSPKGSGGSGIVIVKELSKASGMWSLQSQFSAQQQGTWPKVLFPMTAQIMVVGGGGTSHSAPSTGGGGAGGMILATCQISNSETNSFPITIGAGGAGGRTNPAGGPIIGAKGCNSVVEIDGVTYTAFAGGLGALCNSVPCAAKNGGSGGGGSGEGGPATGGSSIQSSCSPTPLQPFAFGNSGGTGDPGPRQGAGGGGAGSGGSPFPGSTGGSGKDVTPTFGAAPQPFYGPTAGIYAGGGGGSHQSPAPAKAGGPGGGGRGGGLVCGVRTEGQAGLINTGGGGGAGQAGNTTPGPEGNAGNGGSGIVLIKVPSAHAPGTFTASPCTNTVTVQPCGAKVAKFTVSGTLTI